MTVGCQNGVPPAAGRCEVPGPEAGADAPGGAVRQVEGAVEPPVAVVVPKVVERPRVLLAAGDEGRVRCVHGDVVIWFGSMTPRVPEKHTARAEDISAGGGKVR